MLSIAHVLARARAMFPDRLAVWDGETRITFSELGRRVDALAGALRRLGLNKGDRVAILDGNSHRYLESYYAAAQTGIVLLPLNARLAPAELVYILNDAGARALLVSGAFFGAFEAARASLRTLEIVVAHGEGNRPTSAFEYEKLLADAEPLTQPVPVEPDDICQIYYTSGTTGEPKGVCLTYRNMTASMLDAAVGLGLTFRDTWMHAAPLFHLVDAWAVWALPLLGAPQVTMHFEPERLLALIERTRSTAVALPPTLINMVVNHPKVGSYDVRTLRLIMFGGSPAPLGVLQQASQTLPTHYTHAYGITETSGICTLQRPEETLTKAGSAGHTVPHIEAEVVDDDDRLLPLDTVGEVVIRGERVMRDYWNKPEATAEALRDGWYHTGDMGYFDGERNLYIVDRKKDMIITGGENVYSVEVESVLSTHPAVLEVAVIGVPSEQWGEAVKAVVVLRAGSAATEQELIAFCRDKIAGYKIPKSVDFSAEPLPKTSTGKPAKRRLRDRYWEGRKSKI